MGTPVITKEVTRARRQRSAFAIDALALAGIVFSTLVVTGLPYAYAYWSAPPDRQFMGILLNVPDHTQYFSWARELSQAWLIENKLTPEVGEPVFFNLFWLVVGRLAVALGWGFAETLQLLRFLAGALYLGTIYWFTSLFVAERLQRWVAFLVVAFGGGLGWLLVVFKQFTGEVALPLTLYVAEANTFLTIMAFPFAAVAGGLVVLILGLSAIALEKGSFRLAGLAGGLTLALGLQHGYDLLIVYAVVGSATLLLAWRKRMWVRLLALGAAICAPSVPAALYLAYLTRESPIWEGVLAQYGNAGVYTPDPAHLLILMGLPLILLLARGEGADTSEPLGSRHLLLKLWLVVGFFLLYIPTDFQIKMLTAWQVPVGILAVRVLFRRMAPALRERFPKNGLTRDRALGVIFVLAVVPVNVYFFAWRFVDLGRHDYPYYLHRDEVAALDWLGRQPEPTGAVLSSLTTGQYVPGLSGKRAFLAHWAQTLDFYTKRELAARFFDPAASEEERLRMLEGYGVSYVLAGPTERALGGYDLDASPLLERAFSAPSTAVYRVRERTDGLGVNR